MCRQKKNNSCQGGQTQNSCRSSKYFVPLGINSDLFFSSFSRMRVEHCCEVPKLHNALVEHLEQRLDSLRKKHLELLSKRNSYSYKKWRRLQKWSMRKVQTAKNKLDEGISCNTEQLAALNEFASRQFLEAFAIFMKQRRSLYSKYTLHAFGSY